MQKTLKLSYSELLYLVAHCSWMLQAKYYFSIPFMCVPLLFLSFFATIYPLFLSSVSSPLLSPTLITHAISPLAPTVLPLSWTTEPSLHDAPNPSLTFRFSLSLSLSLSLSYEVRSGSLYTKKMGRWYTILIRLLELLLMTYTFCYHFQLDVATLFPRTSKIEIAKFLGPVQTK